MPRKPRPVPPIYQPELAADAIVWAAGARRREIYVGGSTAITILGDKLAPALGDRYLARTGYESQQTEEPAQRVRGDNLFDPLAGDWGARGRFEREAHPRSIQFWATKHRRPIAALAVAALAVGAALRAR